MVQLFKESQGANGEGVVNFDVIKEETLLSVIIMESMTLEESTNAWNIKPETNET